MTSTAISPASPRLRDALEPWSATGSTGALRLQGPVSGTVHLVDGRITYAECRLACGVPRLLTASRRLGAEAWRAAETAGRGGSLPDELTRPGLLAPVELQAAVLAALYGAAHFLLDAHGETRFEVGARHRLSGVVDLDLATVCAEVDRRRAALREAWPDDAVDRAPVVPARRLDGDVVSLTALQWEIVVNAGRRRTPIDLARVLGRDTYATLLSVRRLVAGGLVATGPAGPGIRRSTPAAPTAVPTDPSTGTPAAALTGTGAEIPPEPDPGDPLPTRVAGGTNWPDPPAGGTEPSCTSQELIRIRAALEAMT